MKYEKECIVCGKPFSTDNFNKIMCGRECQKVRIREQNKVLVGDYCDVCGRYFERAKNSSRVTCSSECAKELRDNTASKPKKTKKSKLDKLIKEANKKGISYGQLQAQKYREEMGEIAW